MMKNVLVVALAVAASFCLANNVNAGGGGGAKKNAKIKVVNKDTVALGIILNSNAASWASQAAVLSKGGVVIQPGKSVTFDVVAGSNKITGFDPSAQAPQAGPSGFVNAVKNKTVTVNVNRNGAVQ